MGWVSLSYPWGEHPFILANTPYVTYTKVTTSTMSTVITIPLEKNKEITALVADKQPADRLYACFTIKAKDDQSLILRVEELSDRPEDLPKPDDKEKYEDDDDASIEEGASNGSSPSETDEAIKLASPGGYTGP